MNKSEFLPFNSRSNNKKKEGINFDEAFSPNNLESGNNTLELNLTIYLSIYQSREEATINNSTSQIRIMFYS